ncbi:MAG TPA: NgoBV family restriction endonuclease [Candidatus Dormibacteraeota bacterium]|nr:NgoBV family restriction endonuclease [Candidatus Dormibacteraeota bacterium]
MYGEKAQHLYNLLKRSGIIGAQGTIKLELLGVEVKISQKSSVGNLLQEWLSQWMILNGINAREDANSQVFPDFYLGDSDDHDLLELKTFDYIESPNFDVAAFDAYVDSIRTKAFRLDADYLIFGYTLANGIITINEIWLKKIWEITCGSTEFAIRTNVKRGMIYNIRPYNFKSVSRGFQPFNTKEKFLQAVKNTIEKYRNDAKQADEWLREVHANYTEFINR